MIFDRQTDCVPRIGQTFPTRRMSARKRGAWTGQAARVPGTCGATGLWQNKAFQLALHSHSASSPHSPHARSTPPTLATQDWETQRPPNDPAPSLANTIRTSSMEGCREQTGNASAKFFLMADTFGNALFKSTSTIQQPLQGQGSAHDA